MRRFALQCLLLLCCFGTFALSATRVQATAYTVTTLNDSTTGNGCTAAGTGDGCTLREAITASNTAGGTNTIGFNTGLTGTLTLATPLPSLTANATITGPGATTLTITRGSSGANFAIFVVGAGITATLDSLSVTNGAYDPDTQYGGGILVYLGCTLTVDYVRIDGPHVGIHFHTIWRDRVTDYSAAYGF